MGVRQKLAGGVALVLCLFVIFLTGCAKKGEIKNTLEVPQAQKPTAEATTEADRKQAVKEPTSQKPGALQEQTLREESVGKTAAQATPVAAEKTKGETPTKESAALKEPAILKELQIPDITFEYDKYSLTSEAQALLKSHAPAFLKYKEYKLVVEGHCDERGTVEYNLALGEERAAQTAKYLVSLGIERERIRTISYGKEKPLDPDHNEAAWAKNRRVHFVAVPPINK